MGPSQKQLHLKLQLLLVSATCVDGNPLQPPHWSIRRNESTTKHPSMSLPSKVELIWSPYPTHKQTATLQKGSRLRGGIQKVTLVNLRRTTNWIPFRICEHNWNQPKWTFIHWLQDVSASASWSRRRNWQGIHNILRILWVKGVPNR